MMSIEDLLIESSSFMYETAKKHCEKDFVDNDQGCAWYHSVWQYLRALNCVSAPQWHESFYKEAFKYSLSHKKNIRILLSGTADYSFLHLICSILLCLKIPATIDIIDKCPTPLILCKWYMDNLKKIFEKPNSLWISKNVSVNLIKKDLLYFNVKEDQKYDLICSDSFLTRFHIDDAIGVLKKWKDLLKQDGNVITTIRIHNTNAKKNLLDLSQGINTFLSKVKIRYKGLNSSNKFFYVGNSKISESKLLFLAYKYIIKMESFSLGNKDTIKKLFEDCSFLINDLSCIAKVEGEIFETSYFQIVTEENKCL